MITGKLNPVDKMGNLMHYDGAGELRCLQNIFIRKYISKVRYLGSAPIYELQM